MEKYNKKAATGLSARSVLARFAEIQMPDVSIPATDDRELRMKRYTGDRNAGIDRQRVLAQPVVAGTGGNVQRIGGRVTSDGNQSWSSPISA